MRALVPPGFALSARSRHFQKLFASFEVPLQLGDDLPPLDRARTLHSADVPPDLFAALEDARLIATPLGLLALDEALADVGYRAPGALSDGALALWAVRRRAAAHPMARVLRRVRLRLERSAPEPLQTERVARTAFALGDDAALLAAIRKGLADGLIDLWGVRSGPSEVRVEIVRWAKAKRRKQPPTEADLSGPRVVVDSLRIDAATGRIAVLSDDIHAPKRDAAIVGRALADDESLFGDGPAFTLKPLTQFGNEGLSRARLPGGVTRVRVVEIEWTDGEYAYHTAKGSNALLAYEARGGPAGGYVTAAVLRLDVKGVERPVDVALRLPHQIAIRELRNESSVRATLSALGMLSPGAIPDDLWTLAPWIHPEWRFREVVGRDRFDRLVAAKIVESVETRLVGGPSRYFGWSYIAFPLKDEPENVYAVADDLSLPSRTVAASDVVMWRLDRSMLRSHLREHLGLLPPSGAAETGDDDAFLDLGQKRLGDRVLRYFLVLRGGGEQQAKTVARAIRKIAKTDGVVVLVPAGRTLGQVLFEVPLTTAELLGAEPSAAKVHGAVEREFGIEGLIEPWRLAAASARLVLVEATRALWFDGVRIEVVENEWTMAQLLAKRGASGMSTQDVERGAFPQYSAGIARNLARRVRDKVRTAFEANGRSWTEADLHLFSYSKASGWRISVPYEIR